MWRCEVCSLGLSYFIQGQLIGLVEVTFLRLFLPELSQQVTDLTSASSSVLSIGPLRVIENKFCAL